MVVKYLPFHKNISQYDQTLIKPLVVNFHHPNYIFICFCFFFQAPIKDSKSLAIKAKVKFSCIVYI